MRPSRLAITVLTLGLLSFVLLIAGFLLIHLYPPTGHNRFAEEAGVILLSDQGERALFLGWCIGFLTVVLWLLHRKSDKAGKGLAATGVKFGCMALVGSFLYAWSLPVLHRYPRPAEEGAISDLYRIRQAQVTYLTTIGQGSYAPSLKELLDAELIFGGDNSKYRFLMTAGPTDEQGKITTFKVVARPIEYGVTGWANFYLDESGAIRYTVEDRAAWFKDPYPTYPRQQPSHH